MTWFVPYFMFTVSFLPTMQANLDGYFKEYPETYSAEVQGGVELFQFVRLSGGILSAFYEGEVEHWTKHPFYDAYMIRGEVYFGPFAIGAEHVCGHTVVPWHSLPLGTRDQAHDRFYIHFDTRGMK